MKRKNIPFQLASAMRGPDVINVQTIELKTHVTGRLRAIVYRPSEARGVYTGWPMSKGEMRDIVRILSHLVTTPETLSAIHHYVSHLETAVKLTMKHRIWGRNGRTLHHRLGYAENKMFEQPYQ